MNECLKKKQHQTDKEQIFVSQSDYDLYKVHFGSLTVYRFSLKCKCNNLSPSKKCAKFLPMSEQGWGGYMGTLTNSFFNPRKRPWTRGICKDLYRVYVEFPPTPLLYKNGPQGPLWYNNGHRLFFAHLFKSGLTTNLLLPTPSWSNLLIWFNDFCSFRIYCALTAPVYERLAFMKSSISLHGRRLIFSHDESFSIGMRVGNVLKADVFSVS